MSVLFSSETDCRVNDFYFKLKRLILMYLAMLYDESLNAVSTMSLMMKIIQKCRTYYTCLRQLIPTF